MLDMSLKSYLGGNKTFKIYYIFETWASLNNFPFIIAIPDYNFKQTTWNKNKLKYLKIFYNYKNNYIQESKTEHTEQGC